MRCLICTELMEDYFEKKFSCFDLDLVEYKKCPHCGFCASETHSVMTDAEWSALNDDFHSKTHYTDENPYNRNERYFNQAMMLSLMAKHDLVKGNDWLDWGCGVGAVAQLLDRYFDVELKTYDRYFSPKINQIDTANLIPREFDLVLNTAVFEHVRNRNTLDEIESYVGEAGCLAVHTLVPENVPADPDWMYLLPVHCAFHTNKSMQILMDQWGYKCSVYNQDAKLWVMFREEAKEIKSEVDELNSCLGWQYLHFKPGFMNYWT